MPKSRRPADLAALTGAALAQLARECIEWAEPLADPRRVEEDGRAVLQRLVEDRAVRMRHREAIRQLRQALAVDLSIPANRKGDLPRALGLVTRIARGTAIQHRAIVRMLWRLLDYSTRDSATGELVFPYQSKRAAADAVIIGFAEAGLNTHLTAVNVEQIWKRHF